MTEEEAKTKLCCAAMGHPQSHMNQDGLCVGSKCMAWRAEKELFNITRNEWIKPKEIYLSSDKTEYRAIDDGYCGLAGKP